jgi:hypothetical protein
VDVVLHELRVHAPFTLLGTLSGIVIMTVLATSGASQDLSARLFWSLHPVHVLLSALVTAGVFRLHRSANLATTLLVGYLGSIGIATLSDCVIPYLGESLLGFPERGLHLGFVEKWWLVNPLALAGGAIGYRFPRTKAPHAGHVWLSTWASLFHMTMACETGFSWWTHGMVPVFLFLAVWVPCCTSDIVFPLLFSQHRTRPEDPLCG